MNPRVQRRAEQRIDKKEQKKEGKKPSVGGLKGALYSVIDFIFSPRGLVATMVGFLCFVAFDQDLFAVVGLTQLVTQLLSDEAVAENWEDYNFKCEACRVMVEESVMASFDDAAPLNVFTVPKLEPDSAQGMHIAETIGTVCADTVRYKKYPDHMQKYCASQLPGLEGAIKVELHTQDGDRKAHQVVQDLVRSQCYENLGHCSMLDVPPESISSTWSSTNSARDSGVSSQCEMCAFTAREIDGLLARLDGKVTEKNQEYVLNAIVTGTCNNTVIRHPELFPDLIRGDKELDVTKSVYTTWCFEEVLHGGKKERNYMLEGFVDAAKEEPRLMRLDWNCARWKQCTDDWFYGMYPGIKRPGAEKAEESKGEEDEFDESL
jgi:hypothetical protein